MQVLAMWYNILLKKPDIRGNEKKALSVWSIYYPMVFNKLKISLQRLTNIFDIQLGDVYSYNFILKDIFNISSKDSYKNVEYIKGNQSIMLLVKRVNQQTNSIGIQLYPHLVEEITFMADKGENMPAKSTWIEPKLRSGLTIYEY